MDITLEELESFCAELQALSFPQPRQQTFLEVIDLHRIESVSSKLLTFLLNSKAEHGLGHLGLQALFNVLGINTQKAPETIHITPEVHCRLKSNGRVGRVDLVVDVKVQAKGENHLLVIENKINHKVNNPFDLYVKYCQKNYPNHEKTFILMGLKPPQNIPQDYVFIAHSDFCQSLKILLLASEEEAINNSYYRHFVFDYIEAMEAMSTKKPNEEQAKIINFCQNNVALLDQLQEQRDNVRDSFRTQLSEIEALLKTDVFGEIESHNIDDENTWEYLGIYAYSDDFKIRNTSHKVYIVAHWTLKSVYLTIEMYTVRDENQVPLSVMLKLLEGLEVNVISAEDEDSVIVFTAQSKDMTPQILATAIDELYQKIARDI